MTQRLTRINAGGVHIFFRRVDNPDRDHSGVSQSGDENGLLDRNKPLLGFMKFEWCLLAFSIGICIYFAWPSEVIWWSGMLMLAGVSFTYFFAPTDTHLRDYLLLALCLVAGFSRSVL
ncbi:MAG: hypothetical protein JKX72_11735, partial [Robiginitomaculum sp.]|nr:hypothetical protein [Robiginitomaculum sp.]